MGSRARHSVLVGRRDAARGASCRDRSLQQLRAELRNLHAGLRDLCAELRDLRAGLRDLENWLGRDGSRYRVPGVPASTTRGPGLDRRGSPAPGGGFFVFSAGVPPKNAPFPRSPTPFPRSDTCCSRWDPRRPSEESWSRSPGPLVVEGGTASGSRGSAPIEERSVVYAAGTPRSDARWSSKRPRYHRWLMRFSGPDRSRLRFPTTTTLRSFSQRRARSEALSRNEVRHAGSRSHPRPRRPRSRVRLGAVAVHDHRDHGGRGVRGRTAGDGFREDGPAGGGRIGGGRSRGARRVVADGRHRGSGVSSRQGASPAGGVRSRCAVALGSVMGAAPEY